MPGKPHAAMTVLPYGADLLSQLATHIAAHHALPDLSDVTVLLSSPQAVRQLRAILLETAQAQGHGALLGPEIDTLAHWVSTQEGDTRPVLTEHQRELLLVEALSGHSYLYGQGSPWALADSLLKLFDELSARHIRLPTDFAEFLQQLTHAYHINNAPDINTDALVGEAKLVHTLWLAWHQQMQDTKVTDRHIHYLAQLATGAEVLARPGHHSYFAGFNALSKVETDWLGGLLERGQASFFLQGAQPPASEVDYHPDAPNRDFLASLNNTAEFPPAQDDYGQFLETVFHANGESAAPLQERARDFARRFPLSPMPARLRLFEADSAEQEAQAIDLQTRLWWLAGQRNIGIITENRRLARRVRALLERAGIELQDAAGWALSTTSAAATLERWLETVEEDFAHQPLLDLLKSPFLLPNHEREALLSSVYLFEQGIILKENIGRGLARYRTHVQYRQQRLTPELAAPYDTIHSLLAIVGDAAAPLLPLLGDKTHPPAAFLDALQQSLAALGLEKSLSDDAAGQRVLEEIRQMRAAADNASLRMRWDEFRGWLGRTLERFNFQPSSDTRGVQLMSLAQSSLCHFDALIVAGAEREYLPGSPDVSPFFNDGVRQALGLSSRAQQLSARFYPFRRLLESAPAIFISRRKQQDGEDVVNSPWLERLQSFHHIAYDSDLVDRHFAHWVGQANTQVTRNDHPLPQTTVAQPSVVPQPGLIPERVSASGYQQLIDCPYQFFAARCLGLEAPEGIRDMLQKSDYGERVHRCLQAFHADVPDLPGPFDRVLEPACRDDAIQCLESIAQAVFAQDLEDNFLHRGWLRRWLELIPPYIDWQWQHQQEWRVQRTEVDVNTAFAGSSLTLNGRLDRVDKLHDQSLGIIDYKTGAIPKDADVLSGEAVQLPFYALLAQQAGGALPSQVAYLALDNGKVETRGMLEHDSLNSLTLQVGQRLSELFSAMNNGTPVTAWGDEKTCRWCQMSGICRRETWPAEDID
ncbi:MAG: DNA helicase [Gammaproteobacteria bacterium]|nr:DNA helicase [Gammaproteobacteria bacterium]